MEFKTISVGADSLKRQHKCAFLGRCGVAVRDLSAVRLALGAALRY